MNDTRYVIAVAAGHQQVRVSDAHTGESQTFSGSRALYDALGVLADWRDRDGRFAQAAQNRHYDVSPYCEHGVRPPCKSCKIEFGDEMHQMPYRCPDCGENILSGDDHVCDNRLHHGASEMSTGILPNAHRCADCSFTTAAAERMDGHMRATGHAHESQHKSDSGPLPVFDRNGCPVPQHKSDPDV